MTLCHNYSIDPLLFQNGAVRWVFIELPTAQSGGHREATKAFVPLRDDRRPTVDLALEILVLPCEGVVIFIPFQVGN